MSYTNNEDIKIDNSIIQITSNKKDTKKLIINYIIYNKKQIVIDLLNRLDFSIMAISKIFLLDLEMNDLNMSKLLLFAKDKGI